MVDGSLGFGGEESAGASFLRRNGQVWTTDKDGLIPALLTAEIIAKTAIVGGGSETSVTIDATNLSKDSEYMFFCSFPGHYGGMQGLVKII